MGTTVATDLGSSESSLELVVLMLLLFSPYVQLQRDGIGYGLFREESETEKKEMLGLLLERENEIIEFYLWDPF